MLMMIFLFDTTKKMPARPFFNMRIVYMLNLRQFSRPNPSDSNLHQRGEPLGMPNHGNSTYHHNARKHLSNDTNNIFQQLYYSSRIRTNGNITMLKEPKYPPKTNNPLYNALVKEPRKPRISQLVDPRLAMPNPLIQPGM